MIGHRVASLVDCAEKIEADKKRSFYGLLDTPQRAAAAIPGFRFVEFDKIEQTPRKLWLVDKMLGVGELSCLYGPPGSAKSALAGDLAAHVAAGRDWLGRKVVQGAVILVAAERAALIERRLAAWRKHHQVDGLSLAVMHGAVDLCGSGYAAEAIAAVAYDFCKKRQLELRLIVIDTVSRVLAGGDENSPRDIGVLVGNVAHIQAHTGAHVMLTHHTPHTDNRMRGHGALLAACDTTLRLDRHGDVRTAAVVKNNDGPEGEKVAFSLTSVDLFNDAETGATTTAALVIPADSSTPGRKVRLTKAATNALSALREIADEQGAADISKWRSHSYSRISGPDSGKRAHQVAFQRAMKSLLANDLIIEEGHTVTLRR